MRHWEWGLLPRSAEIAFISSLIIRSPERRPATNVPQAQSAGATFRRFYDCYTLTHFYDCHTLTRYGYQVRARSHGNLVDCNRRLFRV